MINMISRSTLTLFPVLAVGITLTCVTLAAPSSAPEPARPTFDIKARVFVTGKAARREGSVGTAHLKPTERELTTILTYRDYRLVRKHSVTVTLNQPVTLSLPDNASLSISVISFNRDLIKIQLVWRLPGQPDVNTKLNVVRNRPAMIGGPRHPAGGIYLLSLTVR